tara:strand:- start:5310 stop:6392 length:1083 start_codon:yes stop_codon:yes gene_type:complete
MLKYTFFVLKVTFIGHEASRTGAPILLLKMLENLPDTEFDININLLKGGPLENKYAKYRKRFFGKPDLFYLHSHSYSFLSKAKAMGVPVICHVLEDKISFQQLPPNILEIFKSYPIHYVVVSDHIKKLLCNEFGIPEEKISMIRTGIDLSEWKIPSQMEMQKFRDGIGIPSDTLIIGGAGQIHPRKGVDLWLQTAYQLKKILPEQKLHFVWVGGEAEGESIYNLLLQEDVERSALRGAVSFVGEVTNPKSYFSLFDVFLLTSRQEPSGTVILENALLQKPVITLEAAGGATELAEQGWVRLVPGIDTLAMAQEIKLIFESDSLRHEITKKGREIVLNEYDVRKTALQAAQIIKSHALITV